MLKHKKTELFSQDLFNKKWIEIKKNLFSFIYRGTSGIDIDLRRVDIDQCPQKNTGAQQPLNIFAGTDKCKQRTTEVKKLGFYYFWCVPNIKRAY